ncbi:MAG: hypothetical protein KJ904_11395 [Alphaproteobacteria bacterium]|nr:hypothetical protein [Alphaproteobacteria bacterium]MBU0796347.1 hypothetical protein [Alphaproteobacteria bacterium]MBU0887764.1 hypothetical protein [Alphaproteobacteria bacterium]MBU1815013.1 hypothetical protein [Alphaproteobacteria bacterium]MBU2091492.1 hypothetical protein [Alphaproteobacteria bacterium]
MMLDRVIGLGALLFFLGFLGIIVFSVMKPALVVVGLIGMALVVYDFYLQLAGNGKGRSPSV